MYLEKNASGIVGVRLGLIHVTRDRTLIIPNAMAGAVKSRPLLEATICGGVSGCLSFPKVSQRAKTMRMTKPTTKGATT